MQKTVNGDFYPSIRHILSRFKDYPLSRTCHVFWSALRFSVEMNFWFSLKVMMGLLVFIGLVLFIGVKEHLDLSDLTRDPNAVYRQSAYVGFISNLGIFIWASTVSVAWMAALMMKEGEGVKVMRSFLNWSGLITLFLALDDVFQVHETLIPYYLGLTEHYLYVAYIALLLAYTVKFYKILLNRNFVVLLFAYLGFAISIIIDELEIYSELWVFLEDCFKFAGICMWCVYFVRSISQSFSMKLEKPVL